MMGKHKKVVPDTSVLITQKLSELVKAGKLLDVKIIIPRFVMDELQAQASRGRDTGFRGLEEVKTLRNLPKKYKITVEIDGRMPTAEEINLAKKGRIDALIKEVANKKKALLITGDYVQALVGEAEGVAVKHYPSTYEGGVGIEQYFGKDTQSVHLKVGVNPMAKVGKPGKVKLVELSDKPVKEKDLKKIIESVTSKQRTDENSFIEMHKHGATVVQLGDYRITITRPPFSDALEMTAVKPIAKKRLEDYKLSKAVIEKIIGTSQGVLISGSPGSGKSTFAAAIANKLAEMGKIVKTFEQPRDLQVDSRITQYAPLSGDWEKTSEILLLARPDYTIFDEVRTTRDFKVFADMRLAGVGMIGVVHSTDPVSAIQRFVGRIELGMIPHVMNTVIYIDAGKVGKIYDVSLSVRVPTGMKDDDLARPVVDIRDFETGQLEYEIYTFGEENVVIPVKDVEKKNSSESPLRKLAADALYKKLSRIDKNIKIEVLSDNRILIKVRNELIPKIIGKKGANIEKLEKKIGFSISVEPIEETMKTEAPFDVYEKGASYYIDLGSEAAGKFVDIYDGKNLILSVEVGKKGTIKVKKKSEIGRKVLAAVASGRMKVFY
ncbi:MAG: Flp pilus assembly complex ATPase component [Candidatus Micrarchaeota archaeon]|nr:Flp pilus assembly complex ATPase component [Candidatus Micrarchaeota archaeon]